MQNIFCNYVFFFPVCEFRQLFSALQNQHRNWLLKCKKNRLLNKKPPFFQREKEMKFLEKANLEFLDLKEKKSEKAKESSDNQNLPSEHPPPLVFPSLQKQPSNVFWQEDKTKENQKSLKRKISQISDDFEEANLPYEIAPSSTSQSFQAQNQNLKIVPEHFLNIVVEEQELNDISSHPMPNYTKTNSYLDVYSKLIFSFENKLLDSKSFNSQ